MTEHNFCGIFQKRLHAVSVCRVCDVGCAGCAECVCVVAVNLISKRSRMNRQITYRCSAAVAATDVVQRTYRASWPKESTASDEIATWRRFL